MVRSPGGRRHIPSSGAIRLAGQRPVLPSPRRARRRRQYRKEHALEPPNGLVESAADRAKKLPGSASGIRFNCALSSCGTGDGRSGVAVTGLCVEPVEADSLAMRMSQAAPSSLQGRVPARLPWP